MKIFAAESLGRIGGEGLGPFSSLGGGSGAGALAKIVSGIIGVLTIVASIWFMFQLLIGGINWLSSGGEKQKLTEARDRITHAFIGLIIVVASWGIIALTGQFLGGFELLNPEALLGKIHF